MFDVDFDEKELKTIKGIFDRFFGKGKKMTLEEKDIYDKVNVLYKELKKQRENEKE